MAASGVTSNIVSNFDNVTSVLDAMTPIAAASSHGYSFLLDPRLALGFCLVIAFVIGNIVGGGRKLPPNVRYLPKQASFPWVGRFWDIPTPAIHAAWHFSALHKKIGPIFQWQIMGVTHVWIGDEEIARDLLITRTRKYCDRNPTPSAVGIKEDALVMPLAGYTDRFRRSKNFVHSFMKHSRPKDFYGWPALENRRTLRRLIETPDRWSEHLVTHCARTIASIAWGDPAHGKKLLTVVPELLRAVSPAGPIVNKLNFLMDLPEFLSPFKQAETRRKKIMDAAFHEALEDVERRIRDGTAPECWSRLWLTADKSAEASKLDRHEAAYAIGSCSFVGIITIGGPLHTFFLALCHYPGWMVKLQEEVDRVCGDRLPTPEDIRYLPRIRATAKELLRWRQSTPLGVPREARVDDVYKGYLIPKGAILHVNNYHIKREPTQYPQGDQFIPERWLDPSWPTYKEPLTEFPNFRGDTSFGHSTRACPGIDLTFVELVLLFGALAWSFDIRPRPGAPPVPWYETNPFVITMHNSFPLDIVPRNEAKRAAIMANCPNDDPGYTLKPKGGRQTRWDIEHDFANGGKLWEWEGLITPHVAPALPIVYPAGV